jgi:tRNA G18 (ribose-2'-O)-methylase SpoU
LKQLSHKDIQNQQQQFPITIVCDAIRTPENIGMCFRIAESFGVSKIYLHESSPATENSNVKRTARNTVNQIAHSTYTNFDNTIQQLKEEGNTIIGIEITDKSIDIPMYGRNSSMNVIHSLGIALYEVTNQLK